MADGQFKKSKTKMMADKQSPWSSCRCENKYKYKINTYVDDFLDLVFDEHNVDGSFDSELYGETL